MTSLTIKLPRELKARLEIESRQSGVSVSALIREAVSERLKESEGKVSLFDRSRDLCGAGDSGTEDLATNPDHLRKFGE